jgi:hypothetical protein
MQGEVQFTYPRNLDIARNMEQVIPDDPVMYIISSLPRHHMKACVQKALKKHDSLGRGIDIWR